MKSNGTHEQSREEIIGVVRVACSHGRHGVKQTTHSSLGRLRQNARSQMVEEPQQ
jgi:hypothetical protein